MVDRAVTKWSVSKEDGFLLSLRGQSRMIQDGLLSSQKGQRSSCCCALKARLRWRHNDSVLLMVQTNVNVKMRTE